MTISLNKTFDLPQEMQKLQRQAAHRLLLKSLFALSAIIAGVAAIVFLNINFLPYGIGLIFLSAVAILQYLQQHRIMTKIFSEATK